MKNYEILNTFDDTFANVLSNKKLQVIVTKLLITGRNPNICLFFLFLLQNPVLLCQKILD